ncbi:hypothetical protein BC939DRAFT_506283 [Gamsiella multidivaricata]|uniref:uncharacterized protein n=1 Tax=Gamsiella multidivaricata TaxID=101098 RepID=UPI00221F8B09|nr:uncharacterized protein BC939DRAFT_506283 [Gamsiella multidivaricata]KAG0369749.1 hypothetical protein BGZ54_009014 [Gamsiella multidivaricata]KAI7818806.1 hypothetical protein BC939DRAFT_506283 [Gamsiella multidivaricata]
MPRPHTAAQLKHNIDIPNHYQAEQHTNCKDRNPAALQKYHANSLNGYSKVESVAQDLSSLSDWNPNDLELGHQQQGQRLQFCQINGSDSYPQDPRPDSPTSLEDSQSESGIDFFSVETADTVQSTPRFPKDHAADTIFDSRLNIADRHNLKIQLELANGHMPISPSQVATPPLSPVKILLMNEQEEDEEDEEEESMDDSNDDNGYEFRTTAESAISGPVNQSGRSDANEHKGEASNERKDVFNQDNEDAIASFESATAPLQDGSSMPAPQPIVPSPVPKMSAWSTLLPGVAPMPVPKASTPKPTGRTPTARRSDGLRLHERFPIVLAPECEAKLSMEMVDLFESLLPTAESHDRRTRLVKKIENILHAEWPGQDIKAEPFGSTVNDLGTSSSDVDICIITSWTGLKNVQMLANAFRKHGMQKVFCVPRAKVPIVKMWDPELHLSCDMNINTSLGLLNTKMIKTYVAIDPRVRPFAMIIKHWARRRVLNDAANGGTISTYTWICIVINFLQMRSPPILPKLHKIPHALSEDNQVVNGNNTSFCQDLESLEGFGLPNKETLGGLLYAFFRRFAIEFDYDNYVVSMREGCYLTKESKGWHLPGKQYKLFCVEEPFDTSRNLGNSSDMISSKGLKEEFKRALEILYKKVSLNECCAQFVFPASYYHSNGSTRKGSNGTIIHNYAPGRRYANGYRTMNNYYDDDYGDDDDDDSVGEISVMETLNIGTRPSMKKNSTGNSKQNYNRRGSGSSSGRGYGAEHGGLSKSLSNQDNASYRRVNDQSNRAQSRNRSKHGKGDEKDGAGDSSRSGGSSRNAKQSKPGSTGSSSSTSRNKKSLGGNGGGRQKNGRGGNGATGNGGRAPRAAVEFSLADIASAAPKLLSTASKSDQESSVQAGDGVPGPGIGGEDSSSGGRDRKKGGKRNVVWSTNSNRGESSRRQPATKAAQVSEQGKVKVIFVPSEDDSSGSRTPPA